MACYLGIDAGTQSMKGVLIDPEQNWVSTPVSVNFGKDLPQYRSLEGFLPSNEPIHRHADPQMWAAALDMLLSKMQKSGLPMGEVKGISGSGQQHGTVYLNENFFTAVSEFSPYKTLAEQLENSYSRKTSPIWMDVSTSRECGKLRDKFGTQFLRKTTGSDATERFSLPQIMKFAADEPEKYQQTAVIHLVSSFLCSLLAGKSAPIDTGDGAGLNLLDLHTLSWNSAIAGVTPGLLTKLPAPVPSSAVAGGLSEYFSKYGVGPGIPVTVWSGDNPCSLIGCGGYAPGSAIISLGTSDTFFGSMDDISSETFSHGHIFGNPAGGFMKLLCFNNGSLTREAIRQKYGFSREDFENAIKNSAPCKYQMLPFLFPESTPPSASGIIGNFEEKSITPAEFIRALTESQMLTMRYHAGSAVSPAYIRMTGGASASGQLRQLAANIFQSPVEIGDFSEAPALGAAMRAANSSGKHSFAELTEKFCKATLRIEPESGSDHLSDRALKNFSALMKEFIAEND